MNVWKIFQALLPKEKKLPEKMTIAEVGQMITDGKVILVRESPIFDRCPDHVVKKIRSYSDTELFGILRSNLDKLVGAEDMFVYNLRVFDGTPRYSSCSSPLKLRDLDGAVQTGYFTIFTQPDDYEIWLAVELVRPCGEDVEPILHVEVGPSNISSIGYPRSEEDGRCLICEGWGCWECGFSGGY